MRDLLAELQAETGERPTTWKPEPGDILVGVLLRYDRVPDLYRKGETAVLAVVRSDAGPVVSVWLGRALLALFKTQKPEPGDRVGVKRLPDVQAPAGKHPYQRWALRVDDSSRAVEAA